MTKKKIDGETPAVIEATPSAPPVEAPRHKHEHELAVAEYTGLSDEQVAAIKEQAELAKKAEARVIASEKHGNNIHNSTEPKKK